MPAKLYVVHASHPCRAVARALEMKGIAFRTVEYVPPMHVPFQRLIFGSRTVPGIRFEDGEKVSGSSAIFRRLDERVPEPRLYPSAEVEEAERWGESVLQPIARRVLWPAFSRDAAAMHGYQEGSKLPALPVAAVKLIAPGATWIERRMNAATEEALAADLRALPEHLDKVDALIADGVLGGPSVNAADLQIAATLRLLQTVGDLRPIVDPRPAGGLARRIFPHHEGDVPAGTLPAAWLPAAAVG